ncbi:MAG: YhcG family protein [Niastella sp.]|uniref:PDDEXK nuclease domain-containing protein n=1 Tax=Niastella sp. TaxID=1869183 RepID=UPI00389A0DD5
METNNNYLQLIQDIKSRISHSRYIAARLANQEQLKLYMSVGALIDRKIQEQQWGSNVITQIASDLKKEMPRLRGFSDRNLRNMRQFYQSYSVEEIWPLLTAKLQVIDNVVDVIWQSSTAKLKATENAISETVVDDLTLRSFMGITFTHHVLLLNKCQAYEERLFYIHRAATEFWTVATLEHYIKEDLFRQNGKLNHNFDTAIHPDASLNAGDFFKDQYLLDFLQLQDGDNENEIENSIVSNITEFILKMGKGFAFIGNQFRLDVEGHEFSIDLLFYNRILRRLVAFEIKKDRFKPEYTGQLHFYLNVLDDKIKLQDELPSIGIILCKEKHDAIVQYSIRHMNTPMGVATFMNSCDPPAEIQQVLPDSDQLRRLI